MGRRALLAALQSPHTPADVELVGEIAAYLQHNYDPEIYALVEKSFGMDFAKLQHAVKGGDGDDFNDVYKGTSVWLRSYLELTSHNEAPGVFHALSALAVASVVIGRRTWIPMGFYDVYPPLGVILVGPSGARKTVAIGTATKLLELMEHDVNVIRERFTPEALVLALHPAQRKTDQDEDELHKRVMITDKTAFVVSPEMAVTFGKSHYLEGLVPLFTRLMDHEGYEGRTKGGGVYVLTNIALGFLGATTRDWMTDEMSASVIKGGFTSRFLIAHAQNSPRVIWRYTATTHDKLQALAEELESTVARYNGPLTIEPTADAFMEQWYAAHRLQGEADLGIGYHSRKHVHILRLALIFAVLNRASQVTMEHLLDAIHLLDYLEPGMEELFRQLSSSQTARDAAHILSLLHRVGGNTTKTTLLNLAVRQLPITRFHEAFAYLRETGMLREDRNRIKLTKKGERCEHEAEHCD